MNVPNQVINIDVNSRLSQNVYLICNNKDSGTRFVDVHLFANTEIFDVSGCTVTAAIVTDGFLIDEEVTCAVDKNIVTVPIDNSTDSYSGIMLVELQIKDVDNNVLLTPIAFKVRVSKSITDDAMINEKSMGTVAEVIKEIAAARGNYESLDKRLESKANKEEIENVFGKVSFVEIAEYNDEIAFVTEAMKEKDFKEAAEKCEGILSRIRVM